MGVLSGSQCMQCSVACRRPLLFCKFKDFRCYMHAGLPYNTIEVLILGNVSNTGTQPINLKGSWIIIPFSMGVQTEFEGIWKRIDDPNNYFQIFCW